MSNDLKMRPEAGVLELLGGIIADVQVLFRQQLALFQYEIRGEVKHVGKSGSLVAVGMLILVVGGVSLSGMLVHLLAWAASSLPLWGCYGLVGAPIAALGAALCFVGLRKFRQAKTVPEESDRELKEKFNG